MILLRSWDQLGYCKSCYQIIPILDGKWAANICLFLKQPTGDPKKDYVISVPLNVVQNSPELVFVFLQILGATFIGLADNVIVYDDNHVPTKTWFLSKSTEEQSIQFDKREFLENFIDPNTLQAQPHTQSTQEPKPGGIDLEKWFPGHKGN